MPVPSSPTRLADMSSDEDAAPPAATDQASDQMESDLTFVGDVFAKGDDKGDDADVNYLIAYIESVPA